MHDDMQRLIELIRQDFQLIERHLREKTLTQFLAAQKPPISQGLLNSGTKFLRLLLTLDDTQLESVLLSICSQSAIFCYGDAQKKLIGFSALLSPEKKRISELMEWKQHINKHTLESVLARINQFPESIQRADNRHYASKVSNLVISLKVTDRATAWQAFNNRRCAHVKRGNYIRTRSLSIARLRCHVHRQRQIKTPTLSAVSTDNPDLHLLDVLRICDAALTAQTEQDFVSEGARNSLCLRAPSLTREAWQLTVQILELSSADFQEKCPGFQAWSSQQYRAQDNCSLLDFILSLI